MRLSACRESALSVAQLRSGTRPHAKKSSFCVRAGPTGSENIVLGGSATVEAPERATERWTQHLSPPPQPSQHEPAWTLQEYQKLFKNYRTEEDYDIDDMEGEIPLDMEGAFYRNGPGIMELGGQKMHCFDGHGLIAKVSFLAGRAHFRSRYVRTKVFEEEIKAEKVLYRGFGSTKPGGLAANFLDIRDKPVANTSMLEWGGKLYALWEAHNPFVLDPSSLETLGEETFGGVLREEQPFTAHPCYDGHTGRLVAFSNGIRHGEGKLHIWEIDHENKIRKAITHKVGLLPVLYLHDFRVTKNWYIFHQAPLGLSAGNALRYLAGGCDQTQQIFFDTSMPGKWWLVPRDGGAPQIIETEPGMIWHYGNAFEDEQTGNVIVDACTMDTFSFGGFDMRLPATVPTSYVARFEIDPQAKTARKTTIMPHSADFPQTNPAYQGDPDYKFLYMAASSDSEQAFPFRRITKLDVQTLKQDTWLAPPGCFVGEPIYVPRSKMPLEKELTVAASLKTGGGLVDGGLAAQQTPLTNELKPAEDDGYVVTLVSDGRRERSSLAIFDARRLEEGPICKLHLRKLLPMAFHCAWSSATYS